MPPKLLVLCLYGLELLSILMKHCWL